MLKPEIYAVTADKRRTIAWYKKILHTIFTKMYLLI